MRAAVHGMRSDGHWLRTCRGGLRELGLGMTVAACALGVGCGDGSPARCGAGTRLADGVCVATDAGSVDDDGGAADGGPAGDAGPPTDAPSGTDGAPGPDAGPAPECAVDDLARCWGDAVLACGEDRTPCAPGERCDEWEWSEGGMDAKCVPADAEQCDFRTFDASCEGDVLAWCPEHSSAELGDGLSWVRRDDCSSLGPDGACVGSPEPSCRTRECGEEFEPACDGPSRMTYCEDGETRYADCGGDSCVSSAVTGEPVCVPAGAVPSDRGSEVLDRIRCDGADTIVVQRHGYEWSQPCEPAVLPSGDDFVTVPTTCSEREGMAQCIPGPTWRDDCEEEGWSCSMRADYCDGSKQTSYSCAVGCSEGRCIQPEACLPSTFESWCMDPALALDCRDDDGDGMGFAGRTPCPDCTDGPDGAQCESS